MEKQREQNIKELLGELGVEDVEAIDVGVISESGESEEEVEGIEGEIESEEEVEREIEGYESEEEIEKPKIKDISKAKEYLTFFVEKANITAKKKKKKKKREIPSPFVSIEFDGITKETEPVENTLKPVWNERLSFDVEKGWKDKSAIITISDSLFAEQIGQVTFKLSSVPEGGGQFTLPFIRGSITFSVSTSSTYQPITGKEFVNIQKEANILTIGTLRPSMPIRQKEKEKEMSQQLKSALLYKNISILSPISTSDLTKYKEKTKQLITPEIILHLLQPDENLVLTLGYIDKKPITIEIPRADIDVVKLLSIQTPEAFEYGYGYGREIGTRAEVWSAWFPQTMTKYREKVEEILLPEKPPTLSSVLMKYRQEIEEMLSQRIKPENLSRAGISSISQLMEMDPSKLRDVLDQSSFNVVEEIKRTFRDRFLQSKLELLVMSKISDKTARSLERGKMALTIDALEDFVQRRSTTVPQAVIYRREREEEKVHEIMEIGVPIPVGPEIVEPPKIIHLPPNLPVRKGQTVQFEVEVVGVWIYGIVVITKEDKIYVIDTSGKLVIIKRENIKDIIVKVVPDYYVIDENTYKIGGEKFKVTPSIKSDPVIPSYVEVEVTNVMIDGPVISLGPTSFKVVGNNFKVYEFPYSQKVNIIPTPRRQMDLTISFFEFRDKMPVTKRIIKSMVRRLSLIYNSSIIEKRKTEEVKKITKTSLSNLIITSEFIAPSRDSIIKSLLPKKQTIEKFTQELKRKWGYVMIFPRIRDEAVNNVALRERAEDAYKQNTPENYVNEFLLRNELDPRELNGASLLSFINKQRRPGALAVMFANELRFLQTHQQIRIEKFGAPYIESMEFVKTFREVVTNVDAKYLLRHTEDILRSLRGERLIRFLEKILLSQDVINEIAELLNEEVKDLPLSVILRRLERTPTEELSENVISAMRVMGKMTREELDNLKLDDVSVSFIPKTILSSDIEYEGYDVLEVLKEIPEEKKTEIEKALTKILESDYFIREQTSTDLVEVLKEGTEGITNNEKLVDDFIRKHEDEFRSLRIDAYELITKRLTGDAIGLYVTRRLLSPRLDVSSIDYLKNLSGETLLNFLIVIAKRYKDKHETVSKLYAELVDSHSRREFRKYEFSQEDDDQFNEQYPEADIKELYDKYSEIYDRVGHVTTTEKGLDEVKVYEATIRDTLSNPTVGIYLTNLLYPFLFIDDDTPIGSLKFSYMKGTEKVEYPLSIKTRLINNQIQLRQLADPNTDIIKFMFPEILPDIKRANKELKMYVGRSGDMITEFEYIEDSIRGELGAYVNRMAGYLYESIYGSRPVVAQQLREYTRWSERARGIVDICMEETATGMFKTINKEGKEELVPIPSNNLLIDWKDRDLCLTKKEVLLSFANENYINPYTGRRYSDEFINVVKERYGEELKDPSLLRMIPEFSQEEVTERVVETQPMGNIIETIVNPKNLDSIAAVVSSLQSSLAKGKKLLILVTIDIDPYKQEADKARDEIDRIKEEFEKEYNFTEMNYDTEILENFGVKEGADNVPFLVILTGEDISKDVRVISLTGEYDITKILKEMI